MRTTHGARKTLELAYFATQLAYNTGVVMVRCYGCDNLHLIADRLNWFDEGSVDVHDLIARYGSAEEAAASDGSVKTSLQLTPADIEVLNREIKDRAAAIAAEKAAAASKLENT